MSESELLPETEHEIFVFGVSGEQLNCEHIPYINTCKAVACSKRFSHLLDDMTVEQIPITPVTTMMDRVEVLLKHGTVGILASGDPLFFGIGKNLVSRFGEEKVRVFPAISAVQLACARFGVAWENLKILSLHGRSHKGIVGQVLSHSRILLFTDNHNSPGKIADLIHKTLVSCRDHTRIENIRVRVAENLGLANERLFSGSLTETVKQQFSPLNMMLFEQSTDSFSKLPTFGLLETEISHSRGLITKAEVRAVILHSLRLPPQGVFWDVGGGSGSISLEAAGIFPDLEIYTVEKKVEEQDNILCNLRAYNRYTIQLVKGNAPQALKTLPAPDRVFIGGSGGKLEEIIKHCVTSLKRSGLIVVSAVLKKTAEEAPQVMKKLGLGVEIKTVSVTRKKMDGDDNMLNPITIITGKK